MKVFENIGRTIAQAAVDIFITPVIVALESLPRPDRSKSNNNDSKANPDNSKRNNGSS